MSKQAVYTVTKDEHGNTAWKRVGSAWANRDGSLNVYLDMLPFDGKLHIRPATVAASGGPDESTEDEGEP